MIVCSETYLAQNFEIRVLPLDQQPLYAVHEFET